MILTDKVKVRIVSKNIETYRKLGYNVEINDVIDIKVEDLTFNSRKLVNVKCDNCGEEKIIKYCDYLKVFNKKNKYYCLDCKSASIKDGVSNKYGEDIVNVFQLKIVKNKTKKTCKERYGVEHHLQDKNILEKQKKTNQELYGVDFIPELKRHTHDVFIELCKKVHGDLYDYSKVNYIRVMDKIIISCKKHGDFEQRAYSHLEGEGCPKCKMSKGERLIMDFLDENNIPYIPQKKFNDCKYKAELPFDFYFPDKNLCIEYDGIQHFMIIENWGGAEEFKLRKKKDKIKNKYCLDHNIKLERIKYDENILEKLKKIFYI